MHSPTAATLSSIPCTESKIKIQRQIRGCKEAKIPRDQGTCLNCVPLENLRFSPGLPVHAVACFITAVGKERKNIRGVDAK